MQYAVAVKTASVHLEHFSCGCCFRGSTSEPSCAQPIWRRWEIKAALWCCRYKYIHMEEMLGNVPGARQIYERWMSFEPDHHGWMSYIKVLQSSCICLVTQCN